MCTIPITFILKGYLMVTSIFIHPVLLSIYFFLFLTKIKFLIPSSFWKQDALFLRLCILTLACSWNSKSHLSLTLFMNPLTLFCSSSSVFTSFIFISVVQSMFFRACILAPPPGFKISFLNRLALSTKFASFFSFSEIQYPIVVWSFS